MNLLLALVVFLGICLWLVVAAFIAMPMFLWMDPLPRPFRPRLLD